MSQTERPSIASSTIVNWGAVIIIVAALLLIMRALPLDRAAQVLGRELDALGPWGPVAFGLIYIVATVALVPGWVLTLAAGAFFGLFVGTVVVSAASTIGAGAAFLIARYAARDAVERRIARRRRLQALDEAIGDGGWKMVVLLRLSPAIPFNLQNYLYGLTKIRFWPCLIASWLAMLPGTFMYVYIGHLAGAVVSADRQRSTAEWIALAVGLAATVAATIYITVLARRRLRSRTQLSEDDRETTAAGRRASSAGASVGRTVALATIAALCATAAVYAQLRQSQVRAVVGGWFGPPAVTMDEVYQQRPAGPTFDHGELDAVLVEHVDDAGWVDYAALAANPARLDAYITAVGAADFDALGRDEKLALLLNAYNAFTLRLVLDHWNGDELGSIRDIPQSSRWTDARWSIAGRAFSLDEIEHRRIRARFREPRIHFALVCAAVGCPPLRNEAYTGRRIDEQLEEQAHVIHDYEQWFRFTTGADVVRLTPIYDWFAGDFRQAAGSVLAYVARYSPNLKATLAHEQSPRIQWLEYDWSLNSAANAQPR